MNTRKYPRTMNEAFGPYAGNYIHDPDERANPWMIAASMIVLCIVLTLLFCGLFK
jgi:hypothetical protein